MPSEKMDIFESKEHERMIKKCKNGCVLTIQHSLTTCKNI
jgi:hypothetical protein